MSILTLQRSRWSIRCHPLGLRNHEGLVMGSIFLRLGCHQTHVGGGTWCRRVAVTWRDSSSVLGAFSPVGRGWFLRKNQQTGCSFMKDHGRNKWNIIMFFTFFVKKGDSKVNKIWVRVFLTPEKCLYLLPWKESIVNNDLHPSLSEPMGSQGKEGSFMTQLEEKVTEKIYKDLPVFSGIHLNPKKRYPP